MEQDNVTKLKDNRPHWMVLILCVSCLHRWVGGVTKGEGLTSLKCPRCQNKNSFASVLPADYVKEHTKGDKQATVVRLFEEDE